MLLRDGDYTCCYIFFCMTINVFLFLKPTILFRAWRNFPEAFACHGTHYFVYSWTSVYFRDVTHNYKIKTGR